MVPSEFTVKELCSARSIDTKTAYALMTFLLGIGVAKEVGVRRTEGKKGAGEKVYSVEREKMTEWFAKGGLP